MPKNKPKLPKIKFSHHYEKLREAEIAEEGGNACLISVCKVNLEDLPKGFLWWDTLYYVLGKGGKREERHFKLPEKGEYLLLVFSEKFSYILFGTLRSPYGKWGDKQMHYQSMIGKEFEVEINAKE